MSEGTIGHYQTIMADPVRMNAYLQAIRAVCPGKVVCEIGVGLGPLSLMALQAGAERVYGIELDAAALDMATRVLRRNGFGASRFVPIHGSSHRVELPERVDVVLSELLNSVAFGENALFFLDDARRRFLAPGGTFLPRSLDTYVALASPATFLAERDFWSRRLREEFGMDYRDMLELVHINNQVLQVLPDELFTPWRLLKSAAFAEEAATLTPAPALFRLAKPCTVAGFCVAFDLELGEGVRIRTFPGEAPTHWQQGFCPFREPIRCERGDVLALQVLIPRSREPRIYLQSHCHRIPAAKVARVQGSGGSGTPPVAAPTPVGP